jgi:hypothetical protein
LSSRANRAVISSGGIFRVPGGEIQLRCCRHSGRRLNRHETSRLLGVHKASIVPPYRTFIHLSNL